MSLCAIHPCPQFLVIIQVEVIIHAVPPAQAWLMTQPRLHLVHQLLMRHTRVYAYCDDLVLVEDLECLFGSFVRCVCGIEVRWYEILPFTICSERVP